MTVSTSESLRHKPSLGKFSGRLMRLYTRVIRLAPEFPSLPCDPFPWVCGSAKEDSGSPQAD